MFEKDKKDWLTRRHMDKSNNSRPPTKENVLDVLGLSEYQGSLCVERTFKLSVATVCFKDWTNYCGDEWGMVFLQPEKKELLMLHYGKCSLLCSADPFLKWHYCFYSAIFFMSFEVFFSACYACLVAKKERCNVEKKHWQCKNKWIDNRSFMMKKKRNRKKKQ